MGYSNRSASPLTSTSIRPARQHRLACTHCWWPAQEAVQAHGRRVEVHAVQLRAAHCELCAPGRPRRAARTRPSAADQLARLVLGQELELHRGGYLRAAQEGGQQVYQEACEGLLAAVVAAGEYKRRSGSEGHSEGAAVHSQQPAGQAGGGAIRRETIVCDGGPIASSEVPRAPACQLRPARRQVCSRHADYPGRRCLLL